MKLDKDFWQNRWTSGQTGWDIGYASTPLVEYFNSLTNKDLRILIPGSGNGYEGEYLIKNGFKNTYVLDIAPLALENLKKRFPKFPEENLIQQDFFDHSGKYDLIVEQTFFCALDPSLRRAYAKKMYDLLNENGILAGLLFDDPLFEDHPPFGGSKKEYIPYFEDLFEFLHFETATNSIKPRAGRELFIELKKKKLNVGKI